MYMSQQSRPLTLTGLLLSNFKFNTLLTCRRTLMDMLFFLIFWLWHYTDSGLGPSCDLINVTSSKCVCFKCNMNSLVLLTRAHTQQGFNALRLKALSMIGTLTSCYKEKNFFCILKIVFIILDNLGGDVCFNIRFTTTWLCSLVCKCYVRLWSVVFSHVIEK